MYDTDRLRLGMTGAFGSPRGDGVRRLHSQQYHYDDLRPPLRSGDALLRPSSRIFRVLYRIPLPLYLITLGISPAHHIPHTWCSLRT